MSSGGGGREERRTVIERTSVSFSVKKIREVNLNTESLLDVFLLRKHFPPPSLRSLMVGTKFWKPSQCTTFSLSLSIIWTRTYFFPILFLFNQRWSFSLTANKSLLLRFLNWIGRWSCVVKSFVLLFIFFKVNRSFHENYTVIRNQKSNLLSPTTQKLGGKNTCERLLDPLPKSDFWDRYRNSTLFQRGKQTKR